MNLDMDNFVLFFAMEFHIESKLKFEKKLLFFSCFCSLLTKRLSV